MIRLAISAIPTGRRARLPFKMMPLRQEPLAGQDENTPAGSISATAVATSSETYQGSPNAKCTSSTPANAVKTSAHTDDGDKGRAIGTGPADVHAAVEDCQPGHGHHSPYCLLEGACGAGMTLTATAAPTRNRAGRDEACR